MATTYLAPLAMSQTKDDLVRYLDMSSATYTMMAKETEKVYKHLTSDRRHLKKNCKHKPPYDWSDIMEKSKDEAMKAIAHGGTPHTNYFWDLGKPIRPDKDPNWVAKWFLYHKFRYRDGRNRNTVQGGDGSHGGYGQVSGYGYGSEGASTNAVVYTGYSAGASNAQQVPEVPAGYNTSRRESQGSGKLIYDPVRDQ